MSLLSTVSSPVLWYRIPMMDVPLLLDSQTVPVPQPQQLFTHSELKSNCIVLAPLQARKLSPFWRCSLTASTWHWLRPPIICNLWCLLLWREDRSVNDSCCWTSSAQFLSGPLRYGRHRKNTHFFVVITDTYIVARILAVDFVLLSF
jgi:hypothetical protein